MKSGAFRIVSLLSVLGLLCFFGQSAVFALDPAIGVYETNLDVPHDLITGLPTYSLDMANTAMIVKAGNYGSIKGDIKNARQPAGTWTGLGIKSSTAAASGGKNGLSVFTGAEYTALPGAHTTFYGETVSSGWVMSTYTWAGDVNLDGIVDNLDYGRIDAIFGSGAPTTWTNGDLNHDSVIDNLDYGIIDAIFGQTGSIRAPWNPAAGASAVPEPSTVVLLLTALVGLGVYWRRR